ncbi:MAG: hypothetical protein ACE5F7_07475 [Nitrospiria bacterium]
MKTKRPQATRLGYIFTKAAHASRTALFALSEQYEAYEGISSIEVTTWKYGFVSLNLRLQNQDQISANHLLDAICHPELIRRRSDTHGQKIGELLVHAEFFRNKIDRVIGQALKKLELKRLTFESGEWE